MSHSSRTVSFLFTDIEGSTRLWEQFTGEMGVALARHDDLLRRLLVDSNGSVFKTLGDSFCAAFTDPLDCLNAALNIQTTLASEQADTGLIIRVRIGTVNYLPIEMIGDMSRMGQPGQRTRLNLTLGEDTDGDGLPDAWERLINPDISKVRPGDDSDKDGMTNLQEYLAGTYAFDPKDGFTLNIVRVNNGAPVLEFTAIRGRTYTLQGSPDLKTWTTQSFRIPAEGADAPTRASYPAADVRKIQIEAISADGQPVPRFFRLMTQ